MWLPFGRWRAIEYHQSNEKKKREIRIQILIELIISFIFITLTFLGLVGDSLEKHPNNKYIWGAIPLYLIFVIIFIGISIDIHRSKIWLKQKYPKLSIVGILLKRKIRGMAIALSILNIFIVVYIGLISYVKYNINFSLLFIVAIIEISLCLYQYLLEYRIRRGFYGNNRYEAKEIIEFIIAESERLDFTDGGKSKKIITNEDLEDIKVKLVALGFNLS